MSDKKIYCYWYERGELQINPDGQVFPCCFIANTMYLAKTFGYPEKGTLERRKDSDRVMFELEEPEALAQHILEGDWCNREYIENESEMCLDNYSINKIINHKWFKKMEKAREKWETAPQICQRMCTVSSNASGHMSRKKADDE